MKAWAIALALILVCEMAFASGKVDFSRCEIILSRKPFGEPPAEAASTGGPPAAAAAFIKDIRMCVITEHPEFGIRVGFVDIAVKKNYYLGVGDTEDGIQLVDADYEKEAALLQKGADSFWINMTGQVNPGSSGPIQAQSLPTDSTIASIATTRPTPAASDRMSYAERVKLRRAAIEERRKQQEEQMKQQSVLSKEEKENALKEYQMELVRAGGEKGPALPIPLTKEMDDQLVAEGVLPSADESGSEPGGNAGPVESAPVPEPSPQ